MQLRSYQTNAIQDVRHAMARKALRVMLYSPTGSGKTEIAQAIIMAAAEKGKRVAFICNRIHLVNQASERFYRNGIRHGIIQGQNTRDIDKQVLIASIQTVAKRGMPPVDLILIDEAHAVAGSAEFRQFLFRRNNVPVIGLSATPFSKGLGKHYEEMGGELFQKLVVAATIPELIEQKFLVDCEIYAPSEPDMTGLKQSRNAFGELDWSDMDVGKAVDKPTLIGDIVSHWLRLANDTPTVCFASSIAHSQHIVEAFRAAGVAAEHIDCYTDEQERKAILGRVARGDTRVISNVAILSEGWDFPACQTMILARPTRSLIRYIQMAGRVLRPFPGKTQALILDHSGTVARLGFPTEDLPLELDNGKAKDAKRGSEEDEEPKASVCPSCKYVKKTYMPVCPQCGFAARKKPDVVELDGELKRVEKKSKKKALTTLGKQEVYSQLLTMQMNRGYSDGWVAHQYRNIFDVWPRGLARIAKEATEEVSKFVHSKQISFQRSKAKETKETANAK